MKVAASIARLAGALVSFLYMILLAPHIVSSGIEPANLTNGWYAGALATAVAWIPILILHGAARRVKRRALVFLSFAPMVFFTTYFALLFAATG